MHDVHVCMSLVIAVILPYLPLFQPLMVRLVGVPIHVYRIAGKFGRELNLVVLRSITTAKLKSAKFPTHIYMYGDPVLNCQI